MELEGFFLFTEVTDYTGKLITRAVSLGCGSAGFLFKLCRRIFRQETLLHSILFTRSNSHVAVYSGCAFTARSSVMILN